LIEIIAQDREEILSPLDPGQLNGDPSPVTPVL